MRFPFDPILQAAMAPWRWLVRRRRLALLLIPFGLATGRVAANDEGVLWTPVLLKPADRTRYDLELTLRARRLLIEDPALARFDITVRINDRVAELSGPVPSMEIAQRAEGNLKSLLGLASVRNRLTIADSSAPGRESGEQSRVDWRMPHLELQESRQTLSKVGLASRFTDVPEEPSFGWRPARAGSQTVSLPVPFLPEGLSRPSETREQSRENVIGTRENLRIGKVDVLVSPTESRQELDVFTLPAIDLRHPDTRPATPILDPSNSHRLKYYFLGL